MLEYELLNEEIEENDNINKIQRLSNLREGSSQKISISNEALQLKVFDSTDGGKVLVRTKRLLNLYNMDEEKVLFEI